MSISNVQREAQSESINPLNKIETKPGVGTTIVEKEISQNLSPLKKFNAVNSEVKIKKQSAPRRAFDVAYKTRVIAAYDACENSAARGALLRREGLYHSRIAAWKHQQASGKTKLVKGEKNAVRIDHLIAKVARLEKEMAQAKVIIEIQKKVSDLLGMHIHSKEAEETSL
jgi:transposase